MIDFSLPTPATKAHTLHTVHSNQLLVLFRPVSLKGLAKILDDHGQVSRRTLYLRHYATLYSELIVGFNINRGF